LSYGLPRRGPSVRLLASTADPYGDEYNDTEHKDQEAHDDRLPTHAHRSAYPDCTVGILAVHDSPARRRASSGCSRSRTFGITFSSRSESADIFVMRTDGSGVRWLTDNRVFEFGSDWQPIPPGLLPSKITGRREA
jgi:hypothetical protein